MNPQPKINVKMTVIVTDKEPVLLQIGVKENLDQRYKLLKVLIKTSLVLVQTIILMNPQPKINVKMTVIVMDKGRVLLQIGVKENLDQLYRLLKISLVQAQTIILMNRLLIINAKMTVIVMDKGRVLLQIIVKEKLERQVNIAMKEL
jgi:hypothetical protein